MNRKLLALAIGAVVALPLSAQAAPTLYGKVNVSGDYLSGDSAKDNWELNSNSSRFGVKGEESLGGNLSALYQVEMGVETTDGDATLSSRNRFVGIKSTDVGTLRLGRFDSPFKAAEGAVDVFNDQKYADMDFAIAVDGQGRLSRVAAYTSPTIADVLTIDFAVQQGDNVTFPGETKQQHQADGYSAAATFKQNGLYVALGLEKNIDDSASGAVTGLAPASARDGYRLVAVYTAGDLQIGGLAQSTTSSHEDIGGTGANKADQDSYLLSAAYKMDKCTFKGEVGQAKLDTGTETKATFYGLGMDHNFTASTKAYGLVAYQKIDNPAPTADEANTVVSLGLETKF